MSRVSSSADTPVLSTDPILVVHVVTSLNIGGLERVVLDLVRHRTQTRVRGRVICLDSSGVVEREFQEMGVPVEAIGTAGSVPLRILKLARRLRQLKPHVVHTHNPQAHIHGALGGRLARVPVIVHTKHGRGYPERHLTAVSRLATAWTSLYVAVSEDAARVARETEHVPATKVLVIHNGIDVDRFSVAGPRRAGGDARAVTVGRLDPIKDQATMLRAVRLVVDQVAGFSLDVVGDGPSRAELEALRESLGLANHVQFHGYDAEVRPYLAEADFFVLSSISEGVPLALLEAMACGLPAVTTDVGGIPEVVVPGETGWLVPPRSPNALAEAMLRIQREPGTLGWMGKAARRRVEARFNLPMVVAQYERAYIKSLGGTTWVVSA